ncbi:MAG: ABC transporter permease subunit [Ruminococcaceae bacterium]|nr:ABC transporter permease subunit [Oscillospiraceae bacterium]
MARLLQANFARLWKTKSFWVCLILTVGLSAMALISNYLESPKYIENMGGNLTANGTGVMLYTAILAALYLGTDYSNGTIRNKLVIGRTRAEIYFANLITTALSGVILLTASWVSTGAVGLCLGGKLGMPAGELALDIAVCVCAIIALCAIFTVIGMLISSKSAIVTITLVSAFALMIIGILIQSRLDIPEFSTSLLVGEDGTISFGEQMPNPMYVSGIQRDIMTAVNDVLPSGQLTQMQMGKAHNEGLMPLYSLGVLAVSTAVGALVFRKKDLK